MKMGVVEGEWREREVCYCHVRIAVHGDIIENRNLEGTHKFVP